MMLNYVESPDEEHGLAPAGLLSVPGVAEHQPLDSTGPHGAHHDLRGLCVASDTDLIEDFFFTFNLRHFWFLRWKSEAREHRILAAECLPEADLAEDVRLHHPEVGVAERHLGRAPHHRRHQVIRGQSLLYCLQAF